MVNSFRKFWVIALFLPSVVAAAPIYVFKESDGTIRFTNKTPPQDVNAQVFTARSAGFSWYRSRNVSFANAKLFLKKYESQISEAASTHKVDPALIKAVIHAESAFNPHAISPKGAIGLMQLMPSTARDLGVRPHDPEENIKGGAKHLARLLKTYSGNLVKAIAAYNAGEEAVNRYGGIPPYNETQTYVKRVMALKDRYMVHG